MNCQTHSRNWVKIGEVSLTSPFTNPHLRWQKENTIKLQSFKLRISKNSASGKSRIYLFSTNYQFWNFKQSANTPTFSFNGLAFKIFENFFIQNFWPKIWILFPKFTLSVNFHISRVSDSDFVKIINLRLYKGSDRENRSGCNFNPSVIIHSQILDKFSTLISS